MDRHPARVFAVGGVRMKALTDIANSISPGLFDGKEGLCERCGKPVEGGRRKYCSTSCANLRGEDPAAWKVSHRESRKHRKEACEACGGTKQLHAHHVDGIETNNVAVNIQTLCVWCHIFIHTTAVRLQWKQPGRLGCIDERT